RALGADGDVPRGLEDLDDQHADDVLVVDHEDPAHSASPEIGKRSVNVAPAPGCENTVRVPPCDSAIPRPTDRPSPVPPVSRFVVKNGSKMRSATSGAMPGPSSATTASTCSRSRRTD